MDRKFEKYIELLPTVQDSTGFIDSDECDSLLFSCLVGCVPGVSMLPQAAYDSKTGMWHRRPCDKPCYPNHSKSTISRDMLLGLAWYAYCNSRLDISEQVIKYALSHCLIMGEGVLSRTLMTPGLLSTYAWISYKLGGPSRPWLRYLPSVESKKTTDYQAHLSVLHIVLRNKLTGKDKHKDILWHHVNRQPSNPLFQYAVGNINSAGRLLRDIVLWPENRLPTNWDRKSGWLIQRDMGDDWKPSSGEKKIHSGGDYIFVYALVNNII